MKSNIIICRSNPIAPDPRVEKEARCLVSAGYNIQVVGWDRSGNLPVQETRDGYSIIRLPIRAEYGHGIHNLPQLLRWQTGLMKWLLHHRNEFDVIHACDFDTIIPAIVMKWLFGKKVVYDIFDFYADHLRATPEWIKTCIRVVDLKMIGMADALILVDDARREQVRKSSPKRMAVIYNSPDDMYDRISMHSLPQSKGFQIAYVGLLQVERGLMEVLSLLVKHPDWCLDLAGFGGDEQLIREKIATLPNVIWHGRVPYDEAIRLSYAADVLFATYDPRIPNHRFSSPNKVFEAMMLGKPIIVARGTNMDRIISDAGCGEVVEYGNLAELEEALLRLQKDEQYREQLGIRARQAYQNEYHWDIMKNRLVNLYASLEE